MRPVLAVLLGLLLLIGIGVALLVVPGEPPPEPDGAAPAVEEPEGVPVGRLEAPSTGEPRRSLPGGLDLEQLPEAVVAEEAVEPPAPARGALAGRAVLVDGAPLPGVVVRLPELRLATETDPDGAFRFDDLPPGLHRVTVSAGTKLGLLGADTFATGDESAELVVAAAHARVFGERGGVRVGVRRVRAARIRGDGSFVPIPDVVSAPSHVEYLDLVLPAGESVLVHAEDAEGVLAAFIDTPPDGGRIGVVTRTGAGGLASLRVTVGPASPALEGAFARVRLVDRSTEAVLEGRVPCAADAVWAGLVPGEYSASVAIESPGEVGGELPALAASTAELELEENAETVLAVDVVPGGRIELVLPEAYQGAEIEPGPLAPCRIAVSPVGGGPALPLVWRDASTDEVTTWISDGPLPAGRWQLEVSTLHVVLWRGETDVPPGATAGVDAR